MIQFKIGDVLVLRSGSEPMTVVGRPDHEHAKLTWMRNGEIDTVMIHCECLCFGTAPHREAHQAHCHRDDVLTLLRAILAQGEKIMASQQDALDALKKIDDATTKQATALTGLGDGLQEVNNDIDDLILKLGTTVPADVLAGLKSAADKTQAISDSLDNHAAFSKALAAKWQTDPVPVPVPPVP